jgi:hypothetical protein
VSSPSSGSKNKPRKNSARKQLARCFRAGFLLDLFFDSEDRKDMFLRNTSLFLTDYEIKKPSKVKIIDILKSSDLEQTTGPEP